MATSTSRGAVNILFLIVTLVIALAGWGLWFVQLQENETLVENATTADAARLAMQTRLGFAEGSYRVAAKLVGPPLPSEVNYAPDLNTPVPDHMKTWTDQIARDLADLPSRIQDQGARAENLRAAWEPIVARLAAERAAVANRDAVIKDKDRRIQELQSQAEEKNRQTQAALDNLRQEAERNNSRLSTQLDQIRGENTALAGDVRTRADALEKTREEANTERQRHLVAERTFDGTVQNMKTKERLERERETPDGNVLSVDPTLGTVFIDVGGKHFLRRGTRFKVYETGKGGVKLEKGWIRVINVADTRAECRVDERSSPRGVEVGDWIYNPFYNPAQSADDKVHFAFLGQLQGRYSREILQSMLRNRGAVIDEQVTVHTDFVVVGEAENPDEGDITEGADYQKARRWGIEMVRPRDLEPFLAN